MSTLAAPAAPTELETKSPALWPRYLLAIALLWIASGIFLVAPDQQAVIVRFGAIAEAHVTSGIHYALPWPIDRVFKLKVRQTRRMAIGAELADTVLGQSQPLASQFITGDQNIINVNAIIQYSVAEPALFLFNTSDVESVIRVCVESQMARRIAHVKVDDILTTEKIAVQNAVQRAAQQDLDAYQAGVVLIGVNIDSVNPPPEATDSFRDVASARADAIRTMNEAQGYANDLVPRARGEAAQIAESASGYKDSRVNRATGDASRFVQIAEEYRKAPDVTARRAYLEAMEEILPRLKKTVVDSNGAMDLTIVRKSDSQGAKR